MSKRTKAQEPIIEMSDYQFAALYCAELKKSGTIDRVRDWLDAHGETRIVDIHDLIKVANEVTA